LVSNPSKTNRQNWNRVFITRCVVIFFVGFVIGKKF
jgi:uncharacterized membrane protein